MALRTGRHLPSRLKKRIMCVEDEESTTDMLNEELDIDSDDEMNLENEEKVQVKNRALKCQKVRVRVKQALCILMGGKM
jgi:hypothetical protein